MFCSERKIKKLSYVVMNEMKRSLAMNNNLIHNLMDLLLHREKHKQSTSNDDFTLITFIDFPNFV